MLIFNKNLTNIVNIEYYNSKDELIHNKSILVNNTSSVIVENSSIQSLFQKNYDNYNIIFKCNNEFDVFYFNKSLSFFANTEIEIKNIQNLKEKYQKGEIIELFLKYSQIEDGPQDLPISDALISLDSDKNSSLNYSVLYQDDIGEYKVLIDTKTLSPDNYEIQISVRKDLCKEQNIKISILIEDKIEMGIPKIWQIIIILGLIAFSIIIFNILKKKGLIGNKKA